jgi:FkbM family methyltransferase
VALESEINPFSRGYFIEAGAANGISQSPTLFLERKYGWRGALIEPHPYQAKLAKMARKSRVYIGALASKGHKNSTIILNAAGLMGTVGKKADSQAFSVQGLTPESFEVAALNLNQVISENNFKREPFRLLVLDLEGYELEVLTDIPALEQQPEYICVETVSFGVEDVANLIGGNFEFLKWLTPQDTLWRLKTAG